MLPELLPACLWQRGAIQESCTRCFDDDHLIWLDASGKYLDKHGLIDEYLRSREICIELLRLKLLYDPDEIKKWLEGE